MFSKQKYFHAGWLGFVLRSELNLIRKLVFCLYSDSSAQNGSYFAFSKWKQRSIFTQFLQIISQGPSLVGGRVWWEKTRSEKSLPAEFGG